MIQDRSFFSLGNSTTTRFGEFGDFIVRSFVVISEAARNVVRTPLLSELCLMRPPTERRALDALVIPLGRTPRGTYSQKACFRLSNAIRAHAKGNALSKAVFLPSRSLLECRFVEPLRRTLLRTLKPTARRLLRSLPRTFSSAVSRTF